MFKKPLADQKTSAPLRSSDRRKLRQRVVAEFGITLEDGDVLVPEGLLSQKFKTHVDEPGLLYWSPDGDPVWFTVGKGSEALIPTVYTLWQKPDLLPFLTTPAAVIPKLIGGADLMIPGVVQHSTTMKEDQLVSIAQYHSGPVLGHPVAVGRMAMASDSLRRAIEDDAKGKAAYVLHAWKDSLWDLGQGKKSEIPEPRPIPVAPAETEHEEDSGVATALRSDARQNDSTENIEHEALRSEPDDSEAGRPDEGRSADEGTASHSAPTLSAEDATSCLRNALLQAIATTLSALPPSSFPMSASMFWSTYILPTRPVVFTTPEGPLDASGVDIKHSTHKTVKMFLKACAKEGLLKLKETKGDVVVTGVSPSHPAVASHQRHRTLQSVQEAREKTEERERQAAQEEEKRRTAIHVREMWKPFEQSLAWFVAAEKHTSDLYTISDIRDTFNAYVTAKQLINPHEQQYINVANDDALARAVTKRNEVAPEFLKRDEALKKIRENMQAWYELRTEGSEPIRKKGSVAPIDVHCKTRQGRKAVTLITGYETYALEAEDLAEEFRRVCQSSTSVSPLPGKTSAMEVMVQGDQRKKVMEILLAKGIPEGLIKLHGIQSKKK